MFSIGLLLKISPTSCNAEEKPTEHQKNVKISYCHFHDVFCHRMCIVTLLNRRKFRSKDQCKITTSNDNDVLSQVVFVKGSIYSGQSLITKCVNKNDIL